MPSDLFDGCKMFDKCKSGFYARPPWEHIGKHKQSNIVRENSNKRYCGVWGNMV